MLIITDLDGTLLPHKGAISKADLEGLASLSEKHTRVIATGRHLHSLRKAIPLDFPIDYAVFSSGAGIINWKTQEIIRNVKMNASDVESTLQRLESLNLSYMLHKQIPDNHYFKYKIMGTPAPDFHRRLERQKELSIAESDAFPKEASQFLVILQKDDLLTFGLLQKYLPEFSVIRVTSPLDLESMWIEIFPRAVSKAKACQFLCEILSIEQTQTMALGNDYNDVELLHWAEHKFIVEDAVEPLKEVFPKVNASTNSPFSSFLRTVQQLNE